MTSEPLLGHFGIGGLPGGEKLLKVFLKMQGIEAITSVAMEEVVPGELRLEDGPNLPFSWAVIVPPFIGAEVVGASGLGNAAGFIPVDSTYQIEGHTDIYAPGIAAAVSAPWQTPVAVGVPKTGFPTEEMARVAAKNIIHQIRGEEPTERKEFGDIPAVCVMDAGNNGVIILADKMLPPCKASVMIPGPQSHWAKIVFEKYFLWKDAGRTRAPSLTTCLPCNRAAWRGQIHGPGGVIGFSIADLIPAQLSTGVRHRAAQEYFRRRVSKTSPTSSPASVPSSRKP